MLEILKELVQKRRVAVLLSLHELDLAQKISDYVVCVNRGAVERCGTPEEIFTPDYMERLYGIEARRFNGAFLQRGTGAGGGKTGSVCHRRERFRHPGVPAAAAAGDPLRGGGAS